MMVQRADSDRRAVRWHAGALNNGLIFGATYYGCTWLPRACSYALGYTGTWMATGSCVEGPRRSSKTYQPCDPKRPRESCGVSRF